MGNSDSKLVFKQGIFRLSEHNLISSSDPYWKSVQLFPCVEVRQTNHERSSGSCQRQQKMSSASSPPLTSEERETNPSAILKHS